MCRNFYLGNLASVYKLKIILNMTTECYVCYEPCVDKAPCLCKTLYVHPSCLTILRLYENKECGVCKTPFDDSDVVVDKPDHIDLPDPPYLCYCLCVALRCGDFYISDNDLAFDTLRILLYLIFVYLLLSIFAPWITPNMIVFVFIYIFILIFYNIIFHMIKKREHMRRLQELHEQLEV